MSPYLFAGGVYLPKRARRYESRQKLPFPGEELGFLYILGHRRPWRSAV